MLPLQLQHSEALTREALGLLLQARLDPTLQIGDAKVTITDDRLDNDVRTLTLTWDGGAIDLAVKIQRGPPARPSQPADEGHSLGLGVSPGGGNAEVVWSHIEWRIRDAIRAGSATIKVAAKNSFYERRGEDEDRNKIHGEASRSLAAAAGLGDRVDVPCGTYNLRSKLWNPSPEEVLHTYVVLALIKSHFNRRESIRGAPLFSLDSASERPRARRKAGTRGSRTRTPTTAAHQDAPTLPEEALDLLAGLTVDPALGQLLLTSMAKAAALAASINPRSWSVTHSPPKLTLNVGSCLLMRLAPNLLVSTADVSSLEALSGPY